MSVISAQAVEKFHVQYRKWSIKGVMKGEWIDFAIRDTADEAKGVLELPLDQECDWRAVRVVTTTAIMKI